ncbi:hypothetical protein [Chryseosolibacter indicus]|uniref:Secreted protein n=1 Tax=Chryseosolibacter indicus TaxID=2782351 RepID=A0ABS5VLU6_9BACT|nr:hypothetical protein [Chryseosolibacter indicus]MBT1701978.1 hypothetical protein [Chryseosolibacter indicus]
MRLVAVLLFLVISTASFSQSKKKRGDGDTNAPNSLNPSFPTEQYAPKKSTKKKSKGPTYESEQQFYERMARLEKTRKKNEKLMEKPQYSNPLYFGHKRPPKKHKAGKLKYCKECGIRH